MTWYRTDKDTREREPVTEAEVKMVAKACFYFPEIAVSNARFGTLDLPFAYYEWSE